MRGMLLGQSYCSVPVCQAGRLRGYPRTRDRVQQVAKVRSAYVKLQTKIQASANEDAVRDMAKYKEEVSVALASRAEELLAEARGGSAEEEGSDTKSLRELNKDDYYPFLEQAGDTLVVVDFYTDWCGPCRVMLPLLVQLAQDLEGKAHIVKFNCNKENKELGRKLDIKVAPTFHLYKNSNKVAELTGAKIDELKELINQNL